MKADPTIPSRAQRRWCAALPHGGGRRTLPGFGRLELALLLVSMAASSACDSAGRDGDRPSSGSSELRTHTRLAAPNGSEDSADEPRPLVWKGIAIPVGAGTLLSKPSEYSLVVQYEDERLEETRAIWLRALEKAGFERTQTDAEARAQVAETAEKLKASGADEQTREAAKAMVKGPPPLELLRDGERMAFVVSNLGDYYDIQLNTL